MNNNIIQIYFECKSMISISIIVLQITSKVKQINTTQIVHCYIDLFVAQFRQMTQKLFAHLQIILEYVLILDALPYI